MPVVVQKYGGSSVGSLEKMRLVAERVAARKRAGAELVVVVSAMGDTTDELLALAKGVSRDPPRRELDMLLSAGERISMALLSMALQELGVQAISFTGSQSGILTDESHANARIVEVKPARILEELGRGRVVIVAGYQGVSRAREVTTLGRGGSDTTAVALAAALAAEACEIYSDVDGVWSADPRAVLDAQKLDAIGHGEMQELARAGAKVLNAQAVEWARRSGIVIHALSTHGGGSGTRVVPEAPARGGRAVGAALLGDLVLLKLQGRDGLGELLALLAERGAAPHETAVHAGGAELWLSLENVHGFAALREELGRRLGGRLDVAADLCAVSLVGHGLCDTPAALAAALAEAAALGGDWLGTVAGGARLSLLVRAGAGKALLQRLHGALVAGERREARTG
ncbi:MAG TPA: aspartate kinase [Myxococcales bacterium]|nr:aspartate kinase [Myxococcales bacterium]